MADVDEYAERFLTALRSKGIAEGDLDEAGMEIIDHALEDIDVGSFASFEEVLTDDRMVVQIKFDTSGLIDAVMSRAMVLAEAAR